MFRSVLATAIATTLMLVGVSSSSAQSAKDPMFAIDLNPALKVRTGVKAKLTVHTENTVAAGGYLSQVYQSWTASFGASVTDNVVAYAPPVAGINPVEIEVFISKRTGFANPGPPFNKGSTAILNFHATKAVVGTTFIGFANKPAQGGLNGTSGYTLSGIPGGTLVVGGMVTKITYPKAKAKKGKKAGGGGGGGGGSGIPINGAGGFFSPAYKALMGTYTGTWTWDFNGSPTIVGMPGQKPKKGP
jgi:hypothetical protein